jgi:hypothetical protein
MSLKRSLTTESDDPDLDNSDAPHHQSSSIKRFKPSTTSNCDPTKILSFFNKNQNLKIDYWSEDHKYNVDFFNAAKKAFLNYNNNFEKHGFQENINKAKKYLCQYGFLPAATFEKTTTNHKHPLSFEFNIINSCVQINDILNK